MRARWASMCCVIGLTAAGVSGGFVASAHRDNPAAALQRAVRELTIEARTALKDNALPRREASFAAEFLREHELEALPGDVVWRTFSRPAHEDPFIDAYVRWQLTGFEPAIPETENENDIDAFEAFLGDLPRYIRNPRSDREMIAQVNRALGAERLSESDQQAIAELDESLRGETRRIELMNHPARELRQWIEEALGDDDPRVHQVRLERIAAMVTAGWDVAIFKREIERGFKAAGESADLSPQWRARIARQARRLSGTRTGLVTRLNVEEGVAQAEFSETAVYDFEVSGWIRALTGKTYAWPPEAL